MSNIMPDSTTETEDKSTIWENISWRIGYRTNMLGEYLVKLGDRFCGDVPMGINDAYELGVASGQGDGLHHHDGRVGTTLSAMLTASRVTVEDLAAKTTMTADRVRDLADDEAVATREEVRELAGGWYLAANAKRLGLTTA
jgi:hypothetical protein